MTPRSPRSWPRVIAHLERYPPEFIILQCGADSLGGDPITHLQLSAASHALAARDLAARWPIVWATGGVLALGGGGYNRGNLARAWNARGRGAAAVAEAAAFRVPCRAPLQPGWTPKMYSDSMTIERFDPDLARAIAGERQRQEDHIELIASENYASPRVLEAQGSVLTNKYAEGYPGKRYYGGCEFVDVVEQLAIDRVKRLFGADYANVQPHSGSQANAAAYMALLESGRHHAGHEPRPWRPPDARRQGEFLRQAVPRGAVRAARRRRPHRLRRRWSRSRWPRSRR